MANGSTELDREGCEYGRTTSASMQVLKERVEKMEKNVAECLAEMKSDQKETRSKLDKISWIPPLIMGVITAALIMLFQLATNGTC